MAGDSIRKKKMYRFSFVTGNQDESQSTGGTAPRNPELYAEESGQHLRELLFEKRDLLLSHMWADVRKEERKLIGRELHDNVNQLLSVAKVYVEMLHPRNETDKEIREKAVEYLMLAIDEIREFSTELVTNRKHMKNLEQSIRKIVDDLGFSTHIRIGVTFENRIERLEESRKLNLFRIVQEQLKNIMCYSKAGNVEITLQVNENNRLVMLIKDDGIGFDPLTVRRGIGLSNISDRAISYGGTAHIHAAPGKGCTLIINIPFVG